MAKNVVWTQGVPMTVECANCGVHLTKKQIKDWEINQFTYVCGKECFEKCS